LFFVTNFFFGTLCRQSTKALDKAVLAKNLFRSAKNFAIFLTLHFKDFLNVARSIVENNFFYLCSLSILPPNVLSSSNAFFASSAFGGLPCQ